MKRLLSLLSFTISCAFAQNSPILLDRHFSPNASSSDFLFAEQNIIDLQNRYKNYRTPQKNPEPNIKRKKGMPVDLPKRSLPSIGSRIAHRSLRLGELIFFWGPINHIAAITQHEIFGHGFRLRELGQEKVKVLGYKINLPPPYGRGGGETQFQTFGPLSSSEYLLITIAGVEANTILAHNTTLSWISNNRIDGREASLRHASSLDLTSYLLSLFTVREIRQNYEEGSGHDIATYIMTLNKLYPSDKDLWNQAATLWKGATLSFFSDYFMYYAIASQLKYIWTGAPLQLNKLTQTPVRFYMPVYRLALTPFGPENQFGNYLLLSRGEPSYFYYKQGSFSKNTYFGFGFENRGLIQRGPHKIGMKFDLWRQPPFLTYVPKGHQVTYRVQFSDMSTSEEKLLFDHTQNGYSDSELFAKKYGGALSFIYQYAFEQMNRGSLYTELGFKSRGYLPGEGILASPIFRFGMNLVF